jgi:hypothetical protein
MDDISLISSYNDNYFRQNLQLKPKHTFMFKIFPENRAAYPDNVEEYDTRRQATENNTTWRMCVACWIIKTTTTHSQYVILIPLPQQKRFSRKRLHVTLCAHCLSSSY